MDNPTEILRHVNERYSQCSSYSDSGYVLFDDVHQEKERLAFRTEFVRPDYFCFEWQDYGPRRGKSERFSTLWSSGDKTLMRRDTSKVTVEEQPSLELAIACATGCSAAAANTVPPLLIAELRASKHLFLLTDLELIGQEVVDEHPCYVLKGSLFQKGDHVLLISKSDYSLRRVTSDKSQTAEGSEKMFKEITGNADLMAKLVDRGIAPPTEMKHKARRFVTEYVYTDVSFDGSIVRAPQPVAV
jgi:hypothetical protein